MFHITGPARRANAGEDLFSALCQLADTTGDIDDDDIINQMIFLLMIFLLMADNDTTTSTVTSMMHELTDLDLVMKEALRLVPPVPLLARRTVKDTEVLGVPIPKGRLTAVAPHLTHHMPE